MSLRIETVNNPRIRAITVGDLAEEVGYDLPHITVLRHTEDDQHAEDEICDRALMLSYDGDRVLTLSYGELVVVSGDLEKFAREVWRAVFDTEPDSEASWYTCVDCDSGDMVEQAAQWHASHEGHTVENLN